MKRYRLSENLSARQLLYEQTVRGINWFSVVVARWWDNLRCCLRLPEPWVRLGGILHLGTETAWTVGAFGGNSTFGEKIRQRSKSGAHQLRKAFKVRP